MPALPEVPNVIKSTFAFSYSGNSRCRVRLFHHFSGTAPTVTNLDAWCASLATAWTNRISPVCSGDVIGQGVTAEDLSSASGAVGSDSFSSTGSRAGSGLPKGVCAVSVMSIARRYRGGKPKTFYPMGTASDVSGTGQWTGGALSAFNTAVGNFFGDMVLAGWSGAGTITNVNVSYYQGFTVVTNPITHRARNVPTLRGAPVVDTVLAQGIDANIGSQRRRNLS